MAETPEQRRQRLVNEAKTMAPIERSAASSTDAERAAAYGSVGKPPPPPAPAEQAAADEAELVSTGAAGSNVSDRIRARGTESARAGLALYSEAGRTRAVQVRNKDHVPVKGYTDAMLGDAPVRRERRFDPDRSARARAGLATVSGPTSNAAAAPPVQVTIQTAPAAQQPAPRSSARAVPAGAVPKAAPGQLPPEALPDVPLEGEPPPGETPEQELARLEAQAASMTPEQLEAQASADYVGEPAPEPTLEELQAEADARKGIKQEQLDAEEDLATERVGVAEAEAEAMADASAKYQDALSQAEAAKAEQDARVQAQLEASDEANNLVQRTAKDAIAAAAIDPKRAWANMGVGRKIAFALSGIAGGIAGSDDPNSYINEWIEEDIEQQRQGAAKAEANVGTARAAADEQGSLYQRTLAAVGDERVTADVVRAARLEQIQADFKARLTKAGVRQLSAEQEVFLTKLEEDMAATQMRLQSAAARNPEFFTKTVNVYDKGTRDGMKLLGKEYIKGGASAGERADAQEGKLEEIDVKGRADAMAKQAEQATKRKAKLGDQAYQLGKDTERLQATITLMDDLLKLDDIPGFGLTEGINTPDKMDTVGKINDIIDELSRVKSGAAITADERESFKAMLMDGVEFGKGSLLESSEGRLRKNVARVRRALQARVDFIKRGAGRETVEYYDRNAAGSDYEPIWSGGGDESVVEED